MKENYQINLPYQIGRRDLSAGLDAQLSHKKMKTMFLSSMSKSQRLTSTFFLISRVLLDSTPWSVGPSVRLSVGYTLLFFGF